MQRIIFCILVQQLLFSTPSVESLTGRNVVSADDRDYQFIVSLQDNENVHICSGILVTGLHVVTNANCLGDIKRRRDVWVVLRLIAEQTSVIRYAVSSWLTYETWATIRGSPLGNDIYDIAIVTLKHEITSSYIRPIRLSRLIKPQVQGKTATIYGLLPENTMEIARASVNILSDDDCERNMRLITNRDLKTNDRILCTAAKPYVLLQAGDGGGPLLDKFGALIGVHTGVGPKSSAWWDHFPDEFLHPYKLNLHLNIPYFRQFIVNVTGIH